MYIRDNIELENFLVNKELENFSNWANKEQFVPSGKGASSRVLSHWNKVNVLPLSGVNEKHLKRICSLLDLLWLSIIMKLRGFGFELPKIATIKTKISKDVDLMKSVRKYPAEMRKVINKRIRNSINYKLEFAFYVCFVEKKPIYLITDSHGKADIITYNNFSYLLTIMDLGSCTIINLHEIVQSFFPWKDLSPGPLKPLTKKDHDLFQLMFELYDSDASEVEIKLNNGEIELIKLTSYENIDSTIERLMEKDDYQEITILMEKGKKKYIKRTRKIKL